MGTSGTAEGASRCCGLTEPELTQSRSAERRTGEDPQDPKDKEQGLGAAAWTCPPWRRVHFTGRKSRPTELGSSLSFLQAGTSAVWEMQFVGGQEGLQS